MKCTECNDYQDCHRAYDLRIKRKRCDKAKVKRVPTNADRIRAMTDDELAELLLHRIDMNGDCPVSVVTKYCKSHNCHQCWLDWLKSPAEGSAEDD